MFPKCAETAPILLSEPSKETAGNHLDGRYAGGMTTITVDSLRAEVATLTAEKAKLLEHSDHDAAEILRLGGELAERTRERDQWKEKWDHTIDNAVCGLSRQLEAAQAEVRRLEREATIKRDDATAWKAMADARLAQRDAARAEVERLRRALIASGRAIGAGLADCVSTDFLMLIPKEAEMEVERLTKERDAAIRARLEFAASEVERFVADFYAPGNNLFQFTDHKAAAKHRAAELRKAARGGAS